MELASEALKVLRAAVAAAAWAVAAAMLRFLHNLLSNLAAYTDAPAHAEALASLRPDYAALYARVLRGCVRACARAPPPLATEVVALANSLLLTLLCEGAPLPHLPWPRRSADIGEIEPRSPRPLDLIATSFHDCTSQLAFEVGKMPLAGLTAPAVAWDARDDELFGVLVRLPSRGAEAASRARDAARSCASDDSAARWTQRPTLRSRPRSTRARV
eukprot:6130125-Pleurochrysis_carterae.AAC.2